MKYLHLLWANLGRKPLRTTLTLASIIVAFLLFGLLEAMRFALSGTISIAGQDRLITIHKVSIIQSLPASYENKIRGVPGVAVTCSHNWFGGVYQNDRNQPGTYAVEAETFFEAYPELELTAAEKKAFLQNKAATVVGREIAQRFGWKVGDVIPIGSNIFTHQDGSRVWDLNIVGIYSIPDGDNNAIYFRYDYFNEGLATQFGRDSIGWVVLRISDPARSAQIASAIDALFANSSTETKTTTEKAFAQGFANQMGNIGAIVTVVVTAVFFTMLLVTANAMAQSVRERTSEIAVMKTLGFSAAAVTALILAESLLLTTLGGGGGIALAQLFTKGVPPAVKQYFPVVTIPPRSFAIAAVMIVGLGILSAALPCIQAARLRIVDALRRT
jgi:putative ABC transport system permease protein